MISVFLRRVTNHIRSRLLHFFLSRTTEVLSLATGKGVYRSFREVVSVYLLIDRIYVYKANSSPVNPTLFRYDNPCFSLKGNNDWWERLTYYRAVVVVR